MSFFDEIKTEIQTEQNQKSNLAEQASAAQASQAASEPAPTAPEVRYTLSKDGAFYFNYFREEMKKQGFVISDLSVSLKDGSFAPLPFTTSGTVRYDFELEHYLSDYPKLYYTWHLEVV